MPVQQFKDAPKKHEYILSSQFDKDLYLQLLKPVNLTSEERKNIAQELVNNRNKYDFYALITKLSDLCFAAKGPEFIRGGSTDFLADILQALAQETDGEHFVAESKKVVQEKGESKHCAFPAGYKMSEVLGRVISIIQAMAIKFAKEKNDSNYETNLGQNLANKVFFPLIINAGEPREAAALVTPFKIWAGTGHADEVRDYFRASTNEADHVSKYFSDKESTHENAIQSIKNLISAKQWSLGGFAFFRGGVTIQFNGVETRVPHRVAAMAALIDEYENSPQKNIYELYSKIQEKAQEALDSPRTGQHQSTREFYRNVISNLYIDKNIVSVQEDSDSENVNLI